jgi:predicted nucleic-acid-binding Zn-ribbon protein
MQLQVIKSSSKQLNRITLELTRIKTQIHVNNYINFIQSVCKHVTWVTLTSSFISPVVKKIIEAFPCIKKLTILNPYVGEPDDGLNNGEIFEIKCDLLEMVVVEFALECRAHHYGDGRAIVNARKLLKVIRFDLKSLKHFRLVFTYCVRCDFAEFNIDEKMFKEFFENLGEKLMKKTARDELGERIYEFSVDD